MPRLRISAISYLNTAPLMWDFDHGELRRSYQVDYTLPSACAEMLRAGMADIGIIPAAAYATTPELAVIPGVAIAARGPVRSIFLIGKKPVEEMRTIAADSSSRSSVALLKVLFAKFYQRNPDFHSQPADLKKMLEACDAALLIGDPALLAHPQSSDLHVYDLAEEWKCFTGKSFVFAFWAVRKAALQDQDAAQIVADFQHSRDHGLEPANIEKTVREWTNRIALPADEIRSYLTEAIHYHLDDDALAGLRLFYQFAAEIKALPAAPALEFLI
jgi:chorismate dehydratase